MIGGGCMGDGFVGGFYAADEEAYQLWLRDNNAPVGHLVDLGYHGTSAVYPNYAKFSAKLSDFESMLASAAGYRERVKSLPTLTRRISDDLQGEVSQSDGELVLDNVDGA